MADTHKYIKSILFLKHPRYMHTAQYAFILTQYGSMAWEEHTWKLITTI